ncbi:MAG: hypothetical protein F6K10_37910 [Moorea sp. SIO2B7]|nr:hypothetical protein [Moorena sp. SIO2B7]
MAILLEKFLPERESCVILIVGVLIISKTHSDQSCVEDFSSRNSWSRWVLSGARPLRKPNKTSDRAELIAHVSE